MRRDFRERWLGLLRIALGEDAIHVACAPGRAMETDEAVAFALSVARTPAEPPQVCLLTRRELDVAVLVAHGLSNRQIGERLVIAERTAASHIEHILDKLGMRSRTQIGIWAAEHELLLSTKTWASPAVASVSLPRARTGRNWQVCR